MIDSAIEIVILFIGLLVPMMIVTMYNVSLGQKLEEILYKTPKNLQVMDYDPKRDKLLFTIGDDREVPPPEVFENIRDQLDGIEKCKVIVVPGCIHVAVLKDEKK